MSRQIIHQHTCEHKWISDTIQRPADTWVFLSVFINVTEKYDFDICLKCGLIQPIPPKEKVTAHIGDNCTLCHHSLLYNMHGWDQNDLEMIHGVVMHSGRCTYCNICNPQEAK